MDRQARIFEALKQARINLEATYIIVRYEMLQTLGASHSGVEMFDDEIKRNLAELDKRIEAHPLYESQK